MLSLAATLLSGTLLAGGIVTNTNHSAMYTRMAARYATIGLDAVYYNPAGLTKLADGLHFSINNQIIGQGRTITSDYEHLNDGEYKGEVSAPIFPGIYAVYKTGQWAFSAGFNPIGGGGGATYDRGLPSFEYSPATLFPALNAQGAMAYRMNANFEGTSIFFGYQANVSYAINDMISVAVGGRFVTAKETYTGHLKGIELEMVAAGNWMRADTIFAQNSRQAAGTASTIQNYIDLGAIQGSDPLADPAAIAALTALGLYQPGMTNDQAVGAFNGAAASLGVTSTLLNDQEVEAEKTATGFTPIVSINITPIEMLNIAVRYEHSTKLEFTNATAKDVRTGFDQTTGEYITMFPDGAKTRLDMPAMLSVGATLRPIEPLLISAGSEIFFEKNADWGGREDLLDGNSWGLGLGAEYSFGEKLLASASYSMTQSGASKDYQTDLSYSLPTNAISFGFAYAFTPSVELNVGAQLVNYSDGDKTFDDDFGIGPVTVIETYAKNVWIIGAGLNISLAK